MPSILDPQNRRPRRSAPFVDPLAAEICEILLSLGGAAPREQVMAALGENRSAPADNALRARAVAVFDAYSGSGDMGANVQPLFRKPYGPGKHRWALSTEAEAFLRAGVPRRVRPSRVILDP